MWSTPPPESQPAGGQGAGKAKCTRELDWTEGTPTVANRTGKWSHGGSRGSGGGGRGSMRGAYLGIVGKRPGR